MRDLRVVELVENVLVEVLGIEPDEVVPHAVICDDLGAAPAQVLRILSRLGHAVTPSGVPQLARGRAEEGFPRTVEELVDRVQAGQEGATGLAVTSVGA